MGSEAAMRPVLIVDDDPGMRAAMRRLLSAAGYHACDVGSAEAAAASPHIALACCLVVDIHLPGQSGIAWYQSLQPPRAPAVFITAFDNAQTRSAAQAAGAGAFLTKPFEGRALLEAVKRTLSGARWVASPTTLDGREGNA